LREIRSAKFSDFYREIYYRLFHNGIITYKQCVSVKGSKELLYYRETYTISTGWRGKVEVDYDNESSVIDASMSPFSLGKAFMCTSEDFFDDIDYTMVWVNFYDDSGRIDFPKCNADYRSYLTFVELETLTFADDIIKLYSEETDFHLGVLLGDHLDILLNL
jgi:hypothetical protein